MEFLLDFSISLKLLIIFSLKKLRSPIKLILYSNLCLPNSLIKKLQISVNTFKKLAERCKLLLDKAKADMYLVL